MKIPHRRLIDMPPPSSTDTKLNQTDQRGGDTYATETNFDTNMVIILAAMLCPLICDLGLNSIVQCAMRCSRRFVLRTPEHAGARLAATGLKKRDLRRIPVAVYSSGANSGPGTAATECPISLGEFLDGEKVRVLPDCNHGFHVRYIVLYLEDDPKTAGLYLSQTNSTENNETRSRRVQ